MSGPTTRHERKNPGQAVIWAGLAILAGLFCIVSTPAAGAQEKEEAGGNRPPLVRTGPSAVDPTWQMLLAACAVAASLLTAAWITKAGRTRRRRPKPVRRVPEDLPMAIPVRVPVATRPSRRREEPSAPPVQEAFWAEEADDLPPLPVRLAPSLSVGESPEEGRIVNHGPEAVEALAQALRAARRQGGAGRRLCQRFQPIFVASDDHGDHWTVGTQTGTWYRAEEGAWVARMPPERVALQEDLFHKLLDLQAAFPAPRTGGPRQGSPPVSP